MKRKYIYILLPIFSLLYSCQKSETLVSELNKDNIGETVKVSFSAVLPTDPKTKAMGDSPTTDIKSMHLVIFDDNGMYVETRKAEILAAKEHNSGERDENGDYTWEHSFETKFVVDLTLTDQPRIIHFIANCPVEQIVYGHEASIIGNMYVEKGNMPNTSYWARIHVPYILVEEISSGDETIHRPDSHIISSFQCIPMLRNYAQIVVKDGANTTEFELLGYTVYNTIDIGTVAPYNNTTQKFQSFVDASGNAYKYPNLAYKGHALAAADLNTNLETIDYDANDTYYDGYKWYNESNPFFMYERKVSVKTADEEKWSESPPHVLIKGLYNGNLTYYKVDLVYNLYEDSQNKDKVTGIEYYNILRNFRYQFTISEVAGKGYDSPEAAINGSTNNNISGSSTTSKFTNISDDVGSIWVSYTDTTLVSNNIITFKYKYMPNLNNDKGSYFNQINNNLVTIEGITPNAEIITNWKFATSDDSEITKHEYDSNTGNIIGGEWDGYREVILYINSPQDMTKEQTLIVRTDNANLSREVRFYLKKKYQMEVECTPLVDAGIDKPVQVDIKLPIGLTEDMFPLDLDIEVYDLSLSPNVLQNVIPVVTGPSTIDDKNGIVTFHYVKTIENKADYDEIQPVGGYKIINTHWLTNIINNESTVYVSNKYFEESYDFFDNSSKTFDNFSINDNNGVIYGIGRNVTVTFKMSDSDYNYHKRNVKVSLVGLVDDKGNSEITIKPAPGNRTITLNLLTTTNDGNVSASIAADNYTSMSTNATRRNGYFNIIGFSDQNGNTITSLPAQAGKLVTLTYDMSDYIPDMSVNVITEDFEIVDATRASYNIKPNGAKNQSITLKTLKDKAGTCSVKLSADGFDDSESESIIQTNEVTYIGNVKKEIGVTFNSSLETNRDYSYIESVEISSNNNTLTCQYDSFKATVTTRTTGRKYYITGIKSFELNNLKIIGENINDETEITISITITSNNNPNTITLNYNISELNLTKQ